MSKSKDRPLFKRADVLADIESLVHSKGEAESVQLLGTTKGTLFRVRHWTDKPTAKMLEYLGYAVAERYESTREI